MTRSKWLIVCIVVTLVVFTAVITVWLVTRNESLFLTLLSIVVSWVLTAVQWPRPEQPTEDGIARTAAQIKKFWDDEADRRRESEVEVNLTPSRWRRVGAAGKIRELLPPADDSNELIHTYVQRPFRLLLLGEPGSGKTAFCVALARQLLAQHDPATPIPVLLQLSSWDRREKPERWIVEQLRTLHNVSRRQAAALIEQRRLLPILDGLDEGPDQSLPDTVRRLNDDRLLGDRPFVLTCREQAFDASNIDHLVERDAEVRIIPLTTNEIVETLDKAFEERPAWTRVIQRLRDEPRGTLAQALNTRLMLFLMTRVFSRSDLPPSSLLDDPRLSTAKGIQDHLVGLFLSHALPKAPRQRFTDQGDDRWLRYLAERLCGSADGRISWWRFYTALQGSKAFIAVRIAVGALITAGLCVIMFGLFGFPWLGLIFGVVLGGVGGAVMSVPPDADPRALPMALRVDEGPWPSRLAALVTAAGGAAAIGYLYRDAVIGVTVGTAIGIGLGLSRRLLTRPTLNDGIPGPDGLLRADRRTVLLAFPLGALVIGFVGAGLGLVGKARDAGVTIPVNTLAQEVMFGAGVAAICGAFTLAMIVQATGAWGRFVLTRFILAMRHDMPWRLMTFLRDAEKAGILRRLGPQYEFRSEMFRDYLKSENSTPPVGSVRS